MTIVSCEAVVNYVRFKVVKVLDRISWVLGKIATYIATAILIGVFFIITLGVIARFTSLRFSWTEELARWGLVSLTYIGASAALRNKQHSGVNIIVTILPAKIAKVVAVVAYLVLMFSVVYFFMNSYEAAMKAVRIRGDILPFSMKYVKMMIPASFFMMFFHLAWGLGDLLTSKGIAGKTIGS